MGRQGNAGPVIIKRKKVVSGGGHHGGAWKVAYADFVTAMMAFFLLMWLLNATTESQRKGLADYFSPSPPIYRISGGGEGAFGGENAHAQDQIAETSRGGSSGRPGMEQQQRGDIAPDEGAGPDSGEDALAQVQEALLRGRAGESMVSEQALRHIVTRLSDEGLIVELFDLPGAPLFGVETDRPEPVLQELAGLLAEAFAPVANGIAVEAHSRSLPLVLAHNPVWDVTTARAQRFRTLLEERGTPAQRIRRVTGHADRRPANANPVAVRNNRLEVILLRHRL